jgi:hypothetical protein
MANEEKDQRPDLRIDGSVATWEMKVEGSISGTYAGTFRFRCFLTPLQIITAGREYRELLGSNMSLANEHESMLAWALSQLKQRVISAPPFWNSQADSSLPGDIPDEEVITTILDAAIASENKYKDQLKKRKEDALKRAKAAGETILENKDMKADKDESQDS